LAGTCVVKVWLGVCGDAGFKALGSYVWKHKADIAIQAGIALLTRGGEGEVSPSTVVGSSRMQLDIGEPGNPLNSRTTIGGVKFSGHAIDRLQGRGIPPSVVKDAIENGRSSPGRSFRTRVYYSQQNNVTVIRNWITRRVVTVRYGRP
jgi:filamentous hemagglutinin